MDETTVATFQFRDQAEITQAHLAAEGITARVVADDEGGLSPGFFADHAVRLVVMPADVDAALAALGDTTEP